MIRKWAGITTVCLFSLLIVQYTHAANHPWNGIADYTAASTATGDEDIVGPFDNYDFSNGGIVLLQQGNVQTAGQFSVGDTYTGFYQSYVIGHTLGGLPVGSSNLKGTGSAGDGSGYELTIVASFTEEITAVNSGNPTFAITGGEAKLYFDTTPDFNFANDIGFANDDLLITGEIVGGVGSFFGAPGVGFSNIELDIGNLGFANGAVYDPDAIESGGSIFTLKINEGVGSVVDQVRNGNNSVGGHVAGRDDILLEADGNLSLVAVPVPAAIWLLGTALLGMPLFAKRRRRLLA